MKYYFFILFYLFFQANETYDKLIQKDFSYFTKLTKLNGRGNVIAELENINKNLDLSIKLDRDVLEFSKEMTQKIVLHERTIEEYLIFYFILLIYHLYFSHQNVSLNISEEDLYKTYEFHA